MLLITLGKFFGHDYFKYLFFPAFYFFSLIIHILICLGVSKRSLKLFPFYYFFCSSDWTNSTDLVSSSLILPDIANLLLNPLEHFFNLSYAASTPEFLFSFFIIYISNINILYLKSNHSNIYLII